MNEKVGYMLKQISDKLKVTADASLKDKNLTFSQARVLQYISSVGGKASQKSIEEYLDVAHPTVVGIVTRMEKSGFFVTYTDQSDKRNKIVELTDQARRISVELFKDIAAHEDMLLEGLTEDDIENLLRMLNIIHDNIH